MLKTLKHADIEKPPKKNKSPSLTRYIRLDKFNNVIDFSSSSSEFLNYTFPSSNPKLAESSTQHESGVVSRAYRLVETRDLANKIYREVYEDRWDAETNPQVEKFMSLKKANFRARSTCVLLRITYVKTC